MEKLWLICRFWGLFLRRYWFFVWGWLTLRVIDILLFFEHKQEGGLGDRLCDYLLSQESAEAERSQLMKTLRDRILTNAD